MKKLLMLCMAISIVACKKEEPKDYATLSGKIENPHESKTLKVFQGRNYEKVITLEEDGTFSDTLKVVEGDYTIQHGDQYGEMINLWPLVVMVQIQIIFQFSLI